MNRWSRWVWAGGLVCGVGYAMLPGRVAERIGRAGGREHALGFAALTAVGVVAGERWRGWMVAAGTFGLGVGIELAQRFVPGRGFEWLDVGADALGVGVGWAIAAVWGWVMRRRTAAKGAAGDAGIG